MERSRGRRLAWQDAGLGPPYGLPAQGGRGEGPGFKSPRPHQIGMYTTPFVLLTSADKLGIALFSDKHINYGAMWLISMVCKAMSSSNDYRR